MGHKQRQADHQMGRRVDLIEKIKQWFSSKTDSDKKIPSKKIRYLIVFGLLGLLLVIMSNAFTSSPDSHEMNISEPAKSNQTDGDVSESAISKKDSATSDVDELETSYEKDLQIMLDKMKGVSNAEVMVNLDSSKVKVYEKDL